MVSPDELIMGGMPYIPQTPVNSLNITQGTAGTAPGTAASILPALPVTGSSTGTSVLVAWFVIMFLLIACNVLTLRVQQ